MLTARSRIRNGQLMAQQQQPPKHVQMPTSTATVADDTTATPVDLSGWFTGQPAEMDAVARQIDEACMSSGFLALTGHGVPVDLMERMLAVSQEFFDLPVDEKMRYFMDDAAANRGYAPFESEALSYSLGIDSEPDLFEAFNIGRETVPPGSSDEVARTYFSPNVWPDAPADMRQVYLDYWDACEQLGHTLTEIFARALGLEPGFFAPFLDRTPSVMRANHYQRKPGHAPSPGQLRMGAHSDYGSLTILLADRVPGLQMLDRQGSFHDVQPPEGGFLVNLGDLLAEWTNDRWRSTVHRVVPPPADATGGARRGRRRLPEPGLGLVADDFFQVGLGDGPLPEHRHLTRGIDPGDRRGLAFTRTTIDGDRDQPVQSRGRGGGFDRRGLTAQVGAGCCERAHGMRKVAHKWVTGTANTNRSIVATKRGINRVEPLQDQCESSRPTRARGPLLERV